MNAASKASKGLVSKYSAVYIRGISPYQPATVLDSAEPAGPPDRGSDLRKPSFQTYPTAPRVQDVGNAAEGSGSFSAAFKIAALNHPDRRILNWP